MDKIIISDLSLRAVIGVYPEERREKQDVVLNIELECDLRAAGGSDDLTDTIDYKNLKKSILALLERSRFQLIESIAEAVAGLCLEDTRIMAVRIRVDKPGALRFARTVAVEIERRR